MMWPGDERDEGENADLETEETLEAEEQLTLADEDERLPWLEADDDYEEPGFDSRLIVMALLGLVAVAAILFAAWHLLRGGPDSEVLADGSTIAAPDEPYKSRPDDPGGTDVSGTGDLSYGVGEGQSREGQLADGAPAPSIDRAQSGSETASGTAGAGASSGESTSGSGVGVQVGAYSSRAAAQSGWSQLRGRFSALQGVDYRIVEGTADSGTIFRLQAVASDGAAADALCRSIRNAGGDCQVKR